MIMDSLAEAAARVGLVEGTKGVRAVLAMIHARAPIGTRELARTTELPLPIVAALRGELERAGLVVRTARGAACTDDGRTLLRGGAMIEPTPERTEGPCVPPALLEAFRALLVHRPSAERRFDQVHATAETALRRARLLCGDGAVGDRGVLVLGDDDFVALAIVLTARHLGLAPPCVCAVDVDGRLVSALAAAVHEVEARVEVHQYDAREPLPLAFAGRFDWVSTDPPYTEPGLRLFLHRAGEALAPDGAGRVHLSFAHRLPEQGSELSPLMGICGFEVERTLPRFNAYDGAGILAAQSQLLILHLAMGLTEPMGRYDGPLVTSEVRRHARYYRCVDCGARIAVGAEHVYPHAGALRDRGCPHCGGGRFRVGRA
jgi:predicted methyltransferase/DNA-directed RNA polymerase subunit RPC12/RpoP